MPYQAALISPTPETFLNSLMVAGFFFCHVCQRGVGKYHERRNFRLFRQFQPQLFQCVKQLGVVRGELCCLRDWRFRFMGLLTNMETVLPR